MSCASALFALKLQRTLISSKARDAETREAFDADRIKYEEEIASLRSTIDGLCCVVVV